MESSPGSREPGDPGRLPPGPAQHSLDARLARFAADARLDEAVAARAREADLRRVAQESATWAGVLTDYAERRTVIVLTTTAGRRHRATVEAVGVDFVELAPVGGAGARLFVAGAAVAWLRAEEPDQIALGDREVAARMTLSDALAVAAEDRPRVVILPLGGAEPVTGILRGVGRDVVTVALDDAVASAAQLPITAIGEVRAE